MELADGSPKLVEISSASKLATIALEEIVQGKVFLKSVAQEFVEANKKSSKHDKKDKAEKGDKVELEQGV